MAYSRYDDEDWTNGFDDAPGPPVCKIPSAFSSSNALNEKSNKTIVVSQSKTALRTARNNEFDEEEDFYDDDWEDCFIQTNDNPNANHSNLPSNENKSNSGIKPLRTALEENRNSLIALGTPLGSIKVSSL